MSSIVERTAGELRGSITHLHKDCAQLQVKEPDTLVHRVWCVWTWDIYDAFSSIQEDPRCWWRLFSGYWVKSRHDSAPPKCFESKEPDNWNSVAISDISDISATYFRTFKHPHFCKHFRFGMCTQVKIKEHKWWEFGCIHWRGTDLRRCWGRQEPKNVKLDCGPSWRHYRKAKCWNRLGKLHFQPSVEEAKIPKKSSIWTPKTDYPIC